MPQAFKDFYPDTRIIIDCTEIRTEMPSSFRAQSESFSSYKHYNTAKGLIGMAPSGEVVFVSSLYGGRTSDKAIVCDCGLLQLLEKGDAIMADRGFDIAEDCAKVGVTVHMPSFMEGKPQLLPRDVVRAKNIAKLRVHVERVIRCVKVFRILANVFPLAMAFSLEHIWQVCCYLTNFLPPVVGFLESNESCPGDKAGSGEEDSFKEHSSPCSEHTEAEVVERESDEAEGIEQESNDCICWGDCCCIFVDDVGHILLPQQFS